MSNIITKNTLKISAIIFATCLTLWVLWTSIVSSVETFKGLVSTSSISTTQMQVDNMRKEIRSADKYIQKLKTKAIDTATIPELLNSLETKVPGVAVEVSAINENSITNILSVSLTFECELAECISIVEQEIESSFLIGVENIAMTELEDGNWSTAMQINVPLLPKNI